MNAIDKTIEYHELLMSLDCLPNVSQYMLPQDYTFEFWNGDNCIFDWMRIHFIMGYKRLKIKRKR